MASAGRTARGLRRIPGTRPRPADQAPRGSAPKKKEAPRRGEKSGLFYLGAGVDTHLLVLILVLLAIGLVMLFSASYANSYYYYGDSYYFIRRQAGFAVFGVACMLAISMVDYHILERFSTFLAVLSVALLAFLLICRYAHITQIAKRVGEATRWLRFGPLEFQPSEVAKFGVILLFAHLISHRLEKMNTFFYGVAPFGAILLVFAGLIYLENHLSGTLIILLIGASMMFVGGTRPRWFVLGALLLAALLMYVFFIKGGYQRQRIDAWLDPWSETVDPDQTYQTRQSLYAIGSGGLLGVGLGQSRQKYLYLPEPQNDFIFAIVCEELGLVGALVIIVLFALLIWRGYVISVNAPDAFGRLLGLGITFQIGLQVVLNICVVTNSLPNTGISLPFFSYGGTSLVMLLGEMGVLLGISRRSNLEKT